MAEGEEDRREFLIAVANEAAWSALTRHLEERGIKPTHSFPPWCAIAELDRPDSDVIRQIPGVRVVEGALSEAELAALPEELRFAAAAWNERLRARENPRAMGRGQSWDAPGFLPPDPPAAFREYLRWREAEEAGGEPEGSEDGSDDKEKP